MSIESKSQTMVKNHDDESSDKNVSRRSVDWRDSGIVVDEDFHPFSMDFSSCELYSTISNSKSQLACQPVEQVIEDDDGDTYLHLAVVGSSIDEIGDLMKNCDLNAINNMMQTPLHIATLANRFEVVQSLLDSGAKFDIPDRRGNTPLHLACQKGYDRVAKTLLDYLSAGNHISSRQRYIEVANYDGQTSLHLANSHGHHHIIALLVTEYQANVNCPDSRSGETILHKAITNFDLDLIAFILQLEPHCNQKDYYGRRPLDTINMLLEYSLGKTQLDTLTSAREMVKDRIDACIQRNGSCLFLMDIQGSDETGSTSSTYSDSDN